ncbi:chaperonin family protein RbcX [Pleurocapsales cyanobacterium LEGE 06147]|nr:chaperonin family protein RbcX [Pleurocapsales cyanobacterium LEGE 06147]
MYPKKIAQDTAKVIQSYLTYQAVKIIIDQLSETNPGEAIWLRQYSTGNKLQDGEAYLAELMSERKELVVRIMTVREYLAEQILEFLPEMVSTGIQQANLQHRRQLLERMTQSQPANSTSSIDNSEPELDIDESSD